MSYNLKEMENKINDMVIDNIKTSFKSMLLGYGIGLSVVLFIFKDTDVYYLCSIQAMFCFCCLLTESFIYRSQLRKRYMESMAQQLLNDLKEAAKMIREYKEKVWILKLMNISETLIII